jgi:uncharacterized membrane protein YkoI
MGVLRASVSVVLILAAATGLCLEARAWVAGEQPEHVPARTVVANASLSLDQAVKMAEERFKARVVRAEAQHEGIHIIYILKLLNDAGHVWTVRVDATNGAIL